MDCPHVSCDCTCTSVLTSFYRFALTIAKARKTQWEDPRTGKPAKQNMSKQDSISYSRDFAQAKKNFRAKLLKRQPQGYVSGHIVKRVRVAWDSCPDRTHVVFSRRCQCDIRVSRENILEETFRLIRSQPPEKLRARLMIRFEGGPALGGE